MTAEHHRSRNPGMVDPGTAIFNPLSLTDLALWFDATRISGLADGAAVGQWDDLSGNARHATEATNKPTYKASGIKNLPSVQFGINSSTKLTTPSFALQNFSLFIVYYISSFAVNYPIVFEQSAVNTGINLTRNGGSMIFRNPIGNEVGAYVTTGITYVTTFRHGSTING
jgi:hypothetical protein